MHERLASSGVLVIPPEGIAAVSERLGLTTGEATLLAPTHPFLATGDWRAFANGDERPGGARLVASIDPRQTDPAGPVGCIGFVRLGGEEAGAPAGAGSSGAVPASPADDRSGSELLAAGVAWVRARGAATIRGPVQLSTWYGHRAMTGGFPEGVDAVPAFPLEPAPEPALPALMEASGFRPVHRAVSCLVDSAVIARATAEAVRRVRACGIRDRPIRLAELDAELRLLHRLSAAAFEGTWALSAITFEEFASIYRPLAGIADPELIRILELRDGTPVGLALALPAWPDARSPGTRGRNFVLKTLGVTAEARRRQPGIGAALIGLSHGAALRQGYSSGIHALMAEQGMAHRLSLRWGRAFRSYATFELPAP